MLNTDASVRNNSFGCGGLLRNRDGDTICCYNGLEGEGSALEQELLAIREGLSVVLRLNIRRIAIGTTSQTAVYIVKEKAKPPWHL